MLFKVIFISHNLCCSKAYQVTAQLTQISKKKLRKYLLDYLKKQDNQSINRVNFIIS